MGFPSDVAQQSPKAWYLVHTKARQEYVARDNLVRQSFQVFLPELRQVRVRRQLPEDSLVPLFPRYLFIRLDRVCDRWAPIRSTLGVAKMVSFGAMPAAVPDELVETIKAGMTAQGWAELPGPKWQPGQTVRISAGPMEGYEAIFSALDGKGRVIVLLNIVGYRTPVVMPSICIEAVA